MNPMLSSLLPSPDAQNPLEERFTLVQRNPGQNDVSYGYDTFGEALAHVTGDMDFDAGRTARAQKTADRTTAIYERRETGLALVATFFSHMERRETERRETERRETERRETKETEKIK